MATQEFMDYYNKEKDFQATPIGKAYTKFKNAHARAWRLDTEDSFSDRAVPRKATLEAMDQARNAERELRELIDKMVKDLADAEESIRITRGD